MLKGKIRGGLRVTSTSFTCLPDLGVLFPETSTHLSTPRELPIATTTQTCWVFKKDGGGHRKQSWGRSFRRAGKLCMKLAILIFCIRFVSTSVAIYRGQGWHTSISGEHVIQKFLSERELKVHTRLRFVIRLMCA